MPTLKAFKLAARARRAIDATKIPIKYGLGRGGMRPSNPTPADKDGFCDCSGFAAWVLGMSRIPKPSRLWWLETTAIHRDATGKQKVFIRIDRAVPGCIVVYPDRNGQEGHIGIVTEVTESGQVFGVDCSSGQFKRTGQAVTRRDFAFFQRSGAIYAALQEDLE